MAVRVSISRQAVDQMRQRFEAAGIIKTYEPATEVQPEALEDNDNPF